MPDHRNRTAITMLGLTSVFAILAACGSGATNESTAPPVVNTDPPSPTTSIPPSPANLSATPGDAEVSLTWSQSSGATSYHVKRATASGGPYTQVGTPTAAAYTDTSLANGTSYYYVVSAVDSAERVPTPPKSLPSLSRPRNPSQRT